MKINKVLITGGLGFLGFNCARKFTINIKIAKIILIDNLYRKGSEKNIPIAKKFGFQLIFGDVAKEKDLKK